MTYLLLTGATGLLGQYLLRDLLLSDQPVAVLGADRRRLPPGIALMPYCGVGNRPARSLALWFLKGTLPGLILASMLWHSTGCDKTVPGWCIAQRL